MFRTDFRIGRGVLTLSAVAVTLLFPVTARAQAPIVQPGAPGEPSRLITAEEATDLAGIRFSEADVRFMQGMISHHAQALEMTELLETRTERDEMRRLAQRIELSQVDEIEMMQDWLRERDQDVTAVDAHHAHDAELMPGMLSAEEMDQLDAARAQAFDRLFLQLMIKHHRGAITMVENLLRQRGSAQDSQLFAFTTDVTSDQSMEIDRMDSMLAGLSTDPRVGLAAGFHDAGQAAWNMELVAAVPKPDGFFDPLLPAGRPRPIEEPDEPDENDETGETETDEASAEPDATEDAEAAADGDASEDADEQDSADADAPAEDADESEDDPEERPRRGILNFANSDLAFTGDTLYKGNYHGFNAYTVENPASPELLASVVCPGGQGDVSIVGDLLIMSVEQTRGRLDCGLTGVADPVSDERFRGLRLFDISDPRLPRQVGAVQTCRGSHTHTVVTDADDAGRIYVYGSGTSSVRPGEELEGCSDESPAENPDTALFRIDVIEIPVDDPAASRVVGRPFVFADPESGRVDGLWDGGDHGPGTQSTRLTNQCHDITAYPEVGLAAGACSGNGILLDISDPTNPTRVDEVTDPGFAYWHSATFNNDGTKVLFTDEWGGGGRARCRASDPRDWGANAIYDIVDGKMEFRGYYKLPAPQSDSENCVAHNGSLIPVPGRDIMVQAWYQGGISVLDFTDSSNPFEIAFFDRGPVDPERIVTGGYWSAYFHKGHIFGSEMARGLDVLRMLPSEHLTQNEIDAASLVAPDVFNVQQQRRIDWPTHPAVARAYLDQLVRSDTVTEADAEATSAVLARLLEADPAAGGDVEADLRAQADEMRERADGASGRTEARLEALADTLTALAGRLQ